MFFFICSWGHPLCFWFVLAFLWWDILFVFIIWILVGVFSNADNSFINYHRNSPLYSSYKTSWQNTRRKVVRCRDRWILSCNNIVFIFLTPGTYISVSRWVKAYVVLDHHHYKETICSRDCVKCLGYIALTHGICVPGKNTRLWGHRSIYKVSWWTRPIAYDRNTLNTSDRTNRNVPWYCSHVVSAMFALLVSCIILEMQTNWHDSWK